jgi:hypothetical protein
MPGPPALEAKKPSEPVTTVLMFALSGEVVVMTERYTTRLQAPPGEALYLWDSVSRTQEVRRFEKLPDYAKPLDPEELKKFEQTCTCAAPLAEKPGDVHAVLAKQIKAADAGERKTALVAMGALDDVEGVYAALNSEHADVRHMAILVLRHWLGRSADHPARWYRLLTKEHQYTPTQAKNFLYLCNGVEEDKRRQAGTYDLLILALNHSKLPIRELAHWHLVRLAPDGNAIAYDAAAPEAQRLKAVEEWRQLIPEGTLPKPAAKKKAP